MRLNKRFERVNEDALGKEFLSFRISPIVLFTLLNITFRYSSKLSWLSKIKPRCFLKAVCLTFVLLKLSGAWSGFIILREKITSCACLVRSGLELIFH